MSFSSLFCAVSEDELAFFVQVLLKRVSRATPLYAEAQKLSADAAAAALYGVALNGVDPREFSCHFGSKLYESPSVGLVLANALCPGNVSHS